jgi:hypothetical protein
MTMVTKSKNVVCAIIGDVVSSRSADQQPMFETLAEVLAWVNREVDHVQPMALAPAAGDEIQGACRSIADALKSTLFIQLRLHGQYQLRFGIGQGSTESPRKSEPTIARSGSAWWNARDAMTALAGLESRKKGLPSSDIRTRLSVGSDGDHLTEALTNGLLLFRDQIVQNMSRTDALVTLELFRGKRQVDIKRELKISQSAVSDVSRKKGAALLIRCQRMLDEVVGTPSKHDGALQ